MKINERLKRVASFVDDNSYIIDVGCDHALLDIYLVKNKKNIKALASDINEGPLKYAIKNIEKYNLSDKIKISLANGISKINSNIDTIIISGMGTSSILDIIFNDKSKLSNIKKIIISSNNNWYLLRKTFMDNGYSILDEDIILEKGKFYPIIVFVKKECNYTNFELKYGPILLKKKTDTFKNYISCEINKLNKIYNNLSQKYFIKKAKLKKEIKILVKI